MNEELQKALAEMLSGVTSAAGNASDFLLAELPDVVMQLLLWHGVYSAFTFVLCGILLLTALYWDVRLGKSTYKKHGVGDELIIGYGAMVSFLRAVVYLLLIGQMNLAWLQIWIAPKVWLLEYAANLAK